MGQAPWKQQQRSSAFKWIKTPAQSPGPAGIGQTGCSLDEDLRLIIHHAAFVFAATVAYMGDTGPSETSAMADGFAHIVSNLETAAVGGGGGGGACPGSERVPAERLRTVRRPVDGVPPAPLSRFTQNSVCHAHTSCDTSAPN